MCSPAAAATHPPPYFWMQLRRFFHTPVSHRTSPPNFRSRSSLSDTSTRVIPLGALVPPSAHDVSCPTCSRPVPPLLHQTRLCRHLRTVSHLTMPPPNYRSRSSSARASSPTTHWIANARHRHIAMLAAPHLHNPLTLLRFAVPGAPAAPATVTTALLLHACHHSLRQVSRMKPTCAPHMGSLLKQRRCDLVCVHLPQLRPCSHM